MTTDHEMIDALAHGRRRNVCEVLSAAGREFLSLEAMSERVAARRENRTDVPADAQTVKVELHHVHLPKLDEAGLLEYDHETNTVYYETDPVVEAIAGGDRPMKAARARAEAEEAHSRD